MFRYTLPDDDFDNVKGMRGGWSLNQFLGTMQHRVAPVLKTHFLVRKKSTGEKLVGMRFFAESVGNKRCDQVVFWNYDEYKSKKR